MAILKDDIICVKDDVSQGIEAVAGFTLYVDYNADDDDDNHDDTDDILIKCLMCCGFYYI